MGIGCVEVKLTFAVLPTIVTVMEGLGGGVNVLPFSGEANSI